MKSRAAACLSSMVTKRYSGERRRYKNSRQIAAQLIRNSIFTNSLGKLPEMECGVVMTSPWVERLPQPEGDE